MPAPGAGHLPRPCKYSTEAPVTDRPDRPCAAAVRLKKAAVYADFDPSSTPFWPRGQLQSQIEWAIAGPAMCSESAAKSPLSVEVATSLRRIHKANGRCDPTHGIFCCFAADYQPSRSPSRQRSQTGDHSVNKRTARHPLFCRRIAKSCGSTGRDGHYCPERVSARRMMRRMSAMIS